jgi:hypothetical protein
MSYIYDLWQRLRPYDCGLEKMRLGREGDGGYVVSREALMASSHLISFGIGDDWSFEMDAIRANPDIQVFAYDKEDNFELRSQSRIKFFKSDVVRDLPYAPENSTLKIDIEGGEWEYLDNIDLGFFVNQLIIEFHLFDVGVPNRVLTKYFHNLYSNVVKNFNNNLFENYEMTIGEILNNFVLFHIHPNNSLKLVDVNGYLFPPLIECSFINKKFVNDKIPMSFDHFPFDGLDFPNKIDRSDIKLQFAVRQDNE